MRAATATGHFAPPLSQHETAPHYFALAGFIAIALLAALPVRWLDVLSTYSTLTLPEWAPPAWLFGPVWAVLYVLMGVAAWGIWQSRGWCSALGLWLGQLALNAAWPLLFFGLHTPDWAFAEIVLLWFSIAASIVAFAWIQPWSGLLLMPYLIWVTFAAVLNFVIWQMNS